MASVFTKIIAGDIPGVFVWKDELAVAFMSINPITAGHTLVVPRQEVDHWIDLEPELTRHLMDVSQAIGKAIQNAFMPARVGQMIAGFEIPHTHIHVIPINSMRDMDFANAAASVDSKELEAHAQRIRDSLREFGYEQIAE